MKALLTILILIQFSILGATPSEIDTSNVIDASSMPESSELTHVDENTMNMAQGAIEKNKVSHQRIFGELGFSKIGDDYYLNTTIGYEFNFKNMGLGVMLPLNFLAYCGSDDDCKGKTTYRIRNEDWNDVSDWFKFVKYFRYGHKYDESKHYYLRLGQLSNASLGHGTIVSNYMNSISWYDFKPGIQFDYYSDKGGIETIVDNFIPTETALLGFRAFVRPIGFFVKNKPYLAKNLAIGLTFTTDIKAKESKDKDNFEVDEYKYESLSIIGMDVELKAFRNKYITILPYLDLNSIVGMGSGFHLGVDTKLHIPLTGAYFSLKPEFRGMSDKYEPGYFDSLYEAHRMGAQRDFKYDWLQSREAKKGIFIEGKYQQNLLDSLLFEFKIAYEDYQGKDNSSLLIYATVPFLEEYKFSAVYAKSRFDSFSDVFDLSSALVILEGVFTVYDPISVRIQYQKTWYENNGIIQEETALNFGINISYTFD